MQAIGIRLAQKSDAPALLAIEQSSFQSDCISPRQMRYLLNRAKALTLVATVDEQVVAYAMVFVPALSRPARLYSIAVSEAYRGRKIALSLMQEALRVAEQKGYKTMRLEVRSTHHYTRDFYAKLGFLLIKHIPHYYQDGEEAIQMERRLNARSDISQAKARRS